MKHMGVVIDKSYWEAVEELPAEKRAVYYIFGHKPLYQLIKGKRFDYLEKGLGKI